MLKKSKRLNLSNPKNRDIFKAPSLRWGKLRAFYRKSPEDFFKAAVVVSKKRVPSAALRNKVRRAIYEVIQNSSFASKPMEILVLYEGGVETAKNDPALKSNAEKLLEKVGSLN